MKDTLKATVCLFNVVIIPEEREEIENDKQLSFIP